MGGNPVSHVSLQGVGAMMKHCGIILSGLVGCLADVKVMVRGHSDGSGCRPNVLWSVNAGQTGGGCSRSALLALVFLVQSSHHATTTGFLCSAPARTAIGGCRGIHYAPTTAATDCIGEVVVVVGALRSSFGGGT